MANHTSKHIIEEIKKGNINALEEVYLEHRDFFLKFALKHNVEMIHAADIYQDTILALHDNIVEGKLSELKSSISTYLIAIGKNKIYQHFRDQGRHHSIEDYHLNENFTELNVNLYPQKLTKQQALYKKCYEQLGKRCKEILNLHLYRGFTLDEITEVLEYSDKKVLKSQKSRCIKHLKELIKNAL